VAGASGRTSVRRGSGLADGSRRVRRDLAVLERALEDRSEEGQCIADRDAAMGRGEALRLPARDRLRPDRPKFQRTERRQDVLVQELPVVHPRLRRKLGCIRLTPGADHVLGERESAHVHLGERPQLLPPPELGTERDGVPLPVERLGSMPASLPPANPPPHRSVLQDPSLDLHAATPWLLFVAFKDATASRCSPVPLSALRGSPGLKCVIGLHTSLHTFLYTWAVRRPLRLRSPRQQPVGTRSRAPGGPRP
jgi:hypothetical protein